MTHERYAAATPGWFPHRFGQGPKRSTMGGPTGA